MTAVATYTLGDVEGRARTLSQARDLLASRLQQLQDEMENAKRKAEPLIKAALGTARAAESELKDAIESSPLLFEKPRTYIFHGIKVGFEKSKGRMTILDPKLTIKLIRKHFDEARAELLVAVKETLRKKALAGLSGAELKKVGVDLGTAGDAVVIRMMDSDLEKALKALLKAAGHKNGDDDGDDE